MSDIGVCLISHNELSRRGEPVLRRTLTSLDRAIDFLARCRPGVAVQVSHADDGSIDPTPDYIADFFHGKPWFCQVRSRTAQFAGSARNLAATQLTSPLICFLDADDEYKDMHLAVCLDVMQNARDAQGKPYLAATTLAEFSGPIHPAWAANLSNVLPITKVVRRQAWDFVEGMPAAAVYGRTTCEDQFFVNKLVAFFQVAHVQPATVVYWSHPGSSAARRLSKFHKPPAAYRLDDEPPEIIPWHKLRIEYETAFLDYLQKKWKLGEWDKRLKEFALATFSA